MVVAVFGCWISRTFIKSKRILSTLQLLLIARKKWGLRTLSLILLKMQNSVM